MGKITPAPMMSQRSRVRLGASGCGRPYRSARTIMPSHTRPSPPLIHQKSAAMRSASRPAGASEDCIPLQPHQPTAKTRMSNRRVTLT
jgi:hypothetical protein